MNRAGGAARVAWGGGQGGEGRKALGDACHPRHRAPVAGKGDGATTAMGRGRKRRIAGIGPGRPGAQVSALPVGPGCHRPQPNHDPGRHRVRHRAPHRDPGRDISPRDAAAKGHEGAGLRPALPPVTSPCSFPRAMLRPRPPVPSPGWRPLPSRVPSPGPDAMPSPGIALCGGGCTGSRGRVTGGRERNGGLPAKTGVGSGLCGRAPFPAPPPGSGSARPRAGQVAQQAAKGEPAAGGNKPGAGRGLLSQHAMQKGENQRQCLMGHDRRPSLIPFRPDAAGWVETRDRRRWQRESSG